MAGCGLGFAPSTPRTEGPQLSLPIDHPADEGFPDSRQNAGDPPPSAGLDQMIEREPSRLKRCWLILGPGLTAGASNNDPSAIATFVQAGAGTGFAMLWVAPVVLPMMTTAVYMCAKLGMVSGRGLSGLLRTYYGRRVLYPVLLCLVIANTFNAGADIGAIAAGLRLVAPVPLKALTIGVTFLLIATQIWASYRLIANLFKWLTFALFAFIAAGFLAKPPVGEVLRHTFVPSFSADPQFLSTLVAIVGATLSPYLYFWQTDQRVEEEKCLGRRQLWQRKGATEGELKYATLDVNVGMFFAFLIIYFVILTTGATLHRDPATRTVETAVQAAAALAPLAGAAAKYLFALGFIGAGLLAIPVLTAGAAYAVTEAFSLPHGLDRRFRDAPAFYSVIVVCTLAGMGIALSGWSPMRVLFWAAVINGLLAGPLLVLVMLASNNRRIMGDKVNGAGVNLLGGLTTLAAFAAAVCFAWIWART